MSFNDGFSTQGIPYITGSDGQVLTWSDTLQQWISADSSGGGGSTFTGVHLDPTNPNLEGVGILSSPLKVSDNINLSSVTASFNGDGSQLTNLPLSNYATKTDVTGAIDNSLISYATTSSVTGAIAEFPTRTEVTGTLNDYATLTGVTASFTTPVQVSNFITGALTNYITGTVVSGNLSGFGTYIDPIILKENISLNSVTASFSGNGLHITNLPTSVDHILYVAKNGNDSNVGSLTDPFLTVQAAINYATTNYPTFSESVLIEIGPGIYTENLTIIRYNTYLRSIAHRQEQRAVTINGKTLINSAASDKYNKVIGLQGLFFSNNSLTDPTVNISGSTHLTYFKDCYIASNGANALKIENVTTSSAKIVLGSTIFLGQKGGADIVDIRGGDVKIDTVEIYYSSGSSGAGNAINQSGNSIVIADRILVDIPSTITGSAYINNSQLVVSTPTCYITNALLGAPLSAPNGVLHTHKTTFLSNVILSNNSTIKANGFGAVTYSNLTSTYRLSFSGFFSQALIVPLNEQHGNTYVSILSASNGITGSFSGSGALLNNIPTSAINNFNANVKSLFSTGSDNLTYSDGVYDLADNIILTSISASFSGSGELLNNLTASNVKNFTSDVRHQFTAGSGIFLDYDTGIITSSAITTVTTSGSITGSGTQLNPIILKDNISVTSITASAISSSTLTLNYIDFNTTLYPTPPPPPATLGRIFYNAGSGDLSTYLDTNGLYLNNGQQLVQKVHNANISPTLTKGTVVHITGSTNAAIPRVTKADWTNDNGSANTLGIIMSDVSFGGEGYVITQGVINYNTSLWSNGDIIYLSGSGGLSNIKPAAPNHTVVVGQVVTSKNDGLLYVSIQNGNELGELHDVNTNGKTNGNLLIWDSSIPAWKNSSILNGYTFTGINNFQNVISGTSAYFSGDVKINGTASISHLDTINQSSLVVGDKYIVIMSGGVDHVGLDGAGILYGSGSTGPTVDENGANAYIKYRNVYDKLEIYPGLRVSGSITASNGISGFFVGDGSNLVNIPASAVNLTSYATLAGVSSSFAALTASNIFTNNQIITGSLRVSTSISSSQITGSFSGSGALLNNLTASNINNFISDVRNQFIAGTGISINYSTGEITSSAAVDLSPYAKSVDVTSSFTTPTQVTNAITNVISVAGSSGSIAYSNGTQWTASNAGTSKQILQSNGTLAPTWVDQVYDFGGAVLGYPGSSEVVMKFLAIKNFTISPTTTDHKFHADVPPSDSSYTFTLKKSGSLGNQTILSAVINQNETTASIASVANNTISIGDYVYLEAQDIPDTSMSNVAFTFAAKLS